MIASSDRASTIRVDTLIDRLATHAARHGVGAVVARLADPSDVAAQVEISGVTHDSRSVQPGWLLCCIRGSAIDGHRFASDAVAAGATALLVDHRLALPSDVAQIVVDDTRVAMGPVAGAFYDFPGDRLELIGITGTNGKTTTAHLLDAILGASGRRSAVIGTLTQTRTTPEATDVQRRLAELREAGIGTVVMEVTSHALELHRVDSLHFAVGVFTNLSQDHLDFHETMEAYFRAKARLFDPTRSASGVVNIDDTHGRLLYDAATIPTLGFRSSDASDVQLDTTSATFVWRGRRIALSMGGAFNVMNALAAATTAETLGVPLDAIVDGLATATVPGRFEPIHGPQPFGVLVDFAHTPDGLERVLQAARSLVAPPGRVIVVFGCGGDRDRSKRPLMGRIATDFADTAILTSDNPRGENPLAIINDVRTGVANAHRLTVQPDRRQAIRDALGVAQAGDVVVIAGKGHESGQEIAGVVHPFDDRDVARAAIRDLFGGE